VGAEVPPEDICSFEGRHSLERKHQQLLEEQKQPDDWRLVFFPWQDDPDYFDSEPQALTAETIRYFSDKPGFSLGQMSSYQRARNQFGMFVAREYPTTIADCFQTPVEGAIYAELIDRLCAEGAIRPAVVDTSALVHTAWDLGSPLNTVVTYFQIIGAEIRVIDCGSDLDLTPAQRVAYMLKKGYLALSDAGSVRKPRMPVGKIALVVQLPCIGDPLIDQDQARCILVEQFP
jgi:hypothetical protein